MPKGSTNAAKTHCPKGHEYTPENTRVVNGSRQCKACQAEWGRRNRDKTRETQRAYRAANRERLNAQSRKRLASDPEARKKNTAGVRRWRFGVTQEQYEEMVAAQQGLCAICGNPETYRNPSGDVKTLAVDHDHVTGRVRELLCSACNKALGLFRDDPDRMIAAAKYVQRHKELADAV